MSEPRELSVCMTAEGQRIVAQIDGRCSSRTGTRTPSADRMWEPPAVSVRMALQGQRVGQNDRRRSSNAGARTPFAEHDASEPPAGCIPQGQTVVGQIDARHRSSKTSSRILFVEFFAI